MPASGTTTSSTAAVAHRGAVMAAAAERAVPLPWGSALESPAVPRSHDANIVRVEHADGALTAAALTATVERVQAGLPHRRFEIWDEASADRLLPALQALGWETDMILLMAFGDGVPQPAPRVGAAAPEELEPLRTEWLRAEIPRSEPVEEIVVQILAGDAVMRAAVPWQAFCVRDGGRPVAMAWLLGDGPVRMVEDVYVTPSHRGRGFGADVVRAAVAAAAGATLVYLPTDADGLARLFYRRLGFTELTVITRFLRHP